MLLKDIGALYTEQVKSYLNAGYVINIHSNCSHGDTSIDLTNWNENIRIKIDRKMGDRFEDIIYLAVYRSSNVLDKGIARITWDSDMDLVYYQEWYKITECYYVSKESYNDIAKKRTLRRANKPKEYEAKKMPPAASEAVVSYVKRVTGRKRIKADEISVERWRQGKSMEHREYRVMYKGKSFFLK